MASIETTALLCGSCGAPLKPGADRCPFCGSYRADAAGRPGDGIAGLFVESFDFSDASIRVISELFGYHARGWCTSYFAELPAVIQVDRSPERLSGIKGALDAQFAKAGAAITTSVKTDPGRIPHENPHCRHLLGDRLDPGVIERRATGMPTRRINTIIVCGILGIIAIIVIAANVADYRRRVRMREEYAKRQEALYPQETKALKEYAAIISDGIPGAECAVSQPATIRVTGNPSLQEALVGFDAQDKKVKSISLHLHLAFEAEQFKRFAEAFTRFEFGGGRTADGGTVPPSKAALLEDGSIAHEEFTVRFSDYHDPMEYHRWLMNRKITFPIDPRTGKLRENGDDGRKKIIDEDGGPPGKNDPDRRPDPIARVILMEFPEPRNSLARDVFRKAIASLGPVIAGGK